MAVGTGDVPADGSWDACRDNGWYGDGACDWFCARPDPDCSLPALGPDPEGSATRYPIVMMHGFAQSPRSAFHFNGMSDALRADGHVVYETEAPPYNGIADRAAALAPQIDRILSETGAAKVNLIAHSMGGLDARYLASMMGYGDRIASISTISTPHRGSAVGDLALRIIDGVNDEVLDNFATALGVNISDLAGDSHLREALSDLSEAAAPAFNAEVLDDPRIHYQSWAGVANVFGIANPRDMDACDGNIMMHPGSRHPMSALFVAMAGAVAHGTELRSNDGLVMVESAKWGDFRGCVPADHASEIGRLTAIPNSFTGFDHLRFYRNIAFELAASGY